MFPLLFTLDSPLVKCRRDTAPGELASWREAQRGDTVPCRVGWFGREETAFRTWYYSRGHPPIFLETQVPARAGRRYSLNSTMSLAGLEMETARRMSRHGA